MKTTQDSTLLSVKNSKKSDSGDYELKLANDSGEKVYALKVVVFGKKQKNMWFGFPIFLFNASRILVKVTQYDTIV